jgi:hypothetical protein
MRPAPARAGSSGGMLDGLLQLAVANDERVWMQHGSDI